DQWNTLVSFGEELVGSFKEFSAGDFFLDSLVSFTQTAINILTWLASILDLGFLNVIIKVVSFLLEVFKIVQAVWNLIQLVVTEGVQVAAEVLSSVIGNLSSLSGILQYLGQIFSIVSTVLNMLIQIATGNLSA